MDKKRQRRPIQRLVVGSWVAAGRVKGKIDGTAAGRWERHTDGVFVEGGGQELQGKVCVRI